MNNPTEIKRQNYLSFFKDGVSDALLNGTVDDDKNSSAYYKKGYDYGLVLYGILKVRGVTGNE
jgi:hypothetical protein